MFVLLEIDKDFSWGIDWLKYSKGVRLGFIGIHVCTVRFSKFIEVCVEGAKEESKKDNQVYKY